MTMSKTYLVKLTPLTPYFFGGENTFGADNRDYYVKGNRLPQQTTLLGFLRYELLAQNNMLWTGNSDKDTRQEWPALIGNSFNGTQLDYGVIDYISPLFIVKDGKKYLPQSMDWALDDKESEIPHPINLSFSNTGNCYTTGHKNNLPTLKVNGEVFEPKFGLADLWVESSGSEHRKWDYDNGYDEKFTSQKHKTLIEKKVLNGFFIEHEQVGIYKSSTTNRVDKGFYRQVFYKLADDFAFAFFAKIELPNGKIFENRIVSMGGERSMFKMEVQEASETFEDIFTESTFKHPGGRQLNALVLTSDAYADPNILAECDYAITNSIPFRHIDPRNVSRDMKQNTPTYLVKRGSIFYGDNVNKLQEDLQKNYPAFYKIGYNHSIYLPKQTQ